MAKFIIEVSDDYILERSELENIMADKEGEDFSVMKKMAEMIVFVQLKSELEKGNNEFYINSKDVESGKEMAIFNNAILDIGMLSMKQQLARENAKDQIQEQ